MGERREEAKEQGALRGRPGRPRTKGVFADLGSDLSSEAQNQKMRLAKGLKGFGTELEEVARNSSGRVPHLRVRPLPARRGLAHWLEHTEGRDMVRSVEDFGRRRPVMFILGCALAGVVAGRLTRGMIDDRSQDWGSAASETAAVAGRPSVRGRAYGSPCDVSRDPDAPRRQPEGPWAPGSAYGEVS